MRVPPSESPTIRGTFHLTDHNGRDVDAESFRGSFVLVFFGFTHCRVVCPRGLARISAALDALGEIPVRVAALYITVDPDRDNPQVMRNYLRAYPSILGLTGSREQIDDAKRNFRVFARRSSPSPDDGGYDVPHTAITYLLDPEGRLVAHFNDAIEASDLIVRLGSHLKHYSPGWPE